MPKLFIQNTPNTHTISQSWTGKAEMSIVYVLDKIHRNLQHGWSSVQTL